MNRLTTHRLDELLRRSQDVRVAVVGDLMLDTYLSGVVTRISPEAPVPVVQIEAERHALGGAANVAANVAAFRAACDIIGFVGRDAGGDHIRTALARTEKGRVRPLLVDGSDRPTTTKTRVMARKQQVVRFDREVDDDLPDEVADQICDLIATVIQGAGALVLEDYNKGVLTPRVIRTALDLADRYGVPVVVDPKFRHIFEYRGVAVFKPNALELTAALGAPIRPADDTWLDEVRERFGCRNLLVTLGEHGMVLRTEAGETLRIPAIAREVYDVSGAGDTVTACLAVGLASGATIEEAALLANYAAAVEVAKPGVATVSPDELRAMVSASSRAE